MEGKAAEYEMWNGLNHYFGVIKYVLIVKLFTIYYQKNERSNTQMSIQEQVSSKDAFKKGKDVK